MSEIFTSAKSSILLVLILIFAFLYFLYSKRAKKAEKVQKSAQEAANLRMIFGQNGKPLLMRSTCAGSGITFNHLFQRVAGEDGPLYFGEGSIFKVFAKTPHHAFVVCTEERGCRPGGSWASIEGWYAAVPVSSLEPIDKV